ncbi:MAG: biotin--[acetyl-CoA-carboxylase] ligase [Rhodocyclaceae bacterium]|nr:biotin--[acetyl-CoA-carboxylase] ligase [Rhodocyclaceae bacterium]
MPSDFSSTLDASRLRAHLGDDAQAFLLDLRDTCPSTNAELLSQPPAVPAGVTPVLACNRQSAGRGRRGRAWLAWPEASLTFSARWQFPVGAPAPAGLSLVAGIAVARVLEEIGVAGVALKWPNDIQVDGRKLGGILVELSGGRALAAVVGIGLNRSFPPGASVPGRADVVALDQLLDAPPEREQLLAALLRSQRALFATYASAGFPAFVGAWNQRNAHAGLPVRVSDDHAELSGICLGVDTDGALLLRTEAGERRVLAGDVSLRGVS